MLTFLQLSDVHLSGLPEGSPLDLDRKLRHWLRRDAVQFAGEIGGVSGVLISGDVAFSATEAQFQKASSWLRELCVRLDIDPSAVWVIPGNHDAQRDETKSPEQRHLRSGFRVRSADVDSEYRRVLSDPEKAARLVAPLKNYNEFAAQFGCEISPDAPFWTCGLELASGVRLCIRGMSSPLISDEHDDLERESLALGTMQTTIFPEEGDVYVSLCHHPYRWLRDGENARRTVDAQMALHITGHDHAHEIRQTTAGMHLCTGALQPEREDEDWEPRYNFVSFEVAEAENGVQLVIRVRVRVWDRNADRFVADSGYVDGVYERSVPLTPVAGPPPRGTTRMADVLDDPERRLRHRTALLSSGDRFAAAQEASLDVDQLATLAHHEVPRTILNLAADAGKLEELWEAVERLHGTPLAPENPFS